MRNLKKTLCLVLALVFVLGLCTVGAVNGTEFDDQETINYTTAVKAMSGLGILVGDDNDGDGKNEFRPLDNVTRAEAAKIVAYMVVGEEAEKWPARSEFDDVPEDHWAAKYITYCKYNNIIAGYGNGKFGPNDPVTQAQFCRMLLSACGYGLKDEFLGANWDQNVAKLAMQSKILKGLKVVDWDAPANRESTAQLAYNTMMDVPQVVLSKDTNDYVAKAAVAGGGTFATATWELQTASGVVVANKASKSNAKGTTLAGGTEFVTDEDENEELLGHYVTIKYRVEGAAPNQQRIAYYVDDECTEVGGAAANKADNAYNYEFYYGDQAAVPAPYAMSAKGGRTYDQGTYVLNADGKIVSYKYSNYFLAVLKLSQGKLVIDLPAAAPYGGATNVSVKAPEGAKAGDILTVYKCGDVYTGKACTKQTGVQLTQSAVDTWGYTSYNNKAIAGTGADNGNVAILATISPFNGIVGVAGLAIGDSYDFYFDAEGGCFGYNNHVDGNAANLKYVAYIASFKTADSFGSDVYYAQVLNDKGEKENLKLGATDTAAGLSKGAICEVTTNVFGISTLTNVTGNTAKKIGAGTYDPSNPRMDYSNATFVWYDSTTALATLRTDTTNKPQAADGTHAAAAINYTYSEDTVGTVTMVRVKTVWFTTKAAAVPYADSYVYVTSSAVKEYKLTNGYNKPYYNGYINGEAMTDFMNANDAAPAVGFYTYTKNAQTGQYSLYTVAPKTGSTLVQGANARDVYLFDQDTSNYILGGKLYAGNNSPIDLTNVKIVKVGAAAGYAYLSVDVSTVDALQSLLVNKYTIQIAFVENVIGLNHSVGGGAIYVYSITKPAA